MSDRDRRRHDRALASPGRRRAEQGSRATPFRRVLEVLAAVLVLASLFAFYQAMAYLGGQDYVAALLVSVVAIAVMRSGIELARSTLCE